ncbi:MAG: 16S rRNA (adenine(1518)-N(6)/adenine(1519)-N(6))-dimethyltransferase RsmA [Mycoplasma sp.]|nr:16S rRNA (adenine(1518)-N(6)/adenine(1519)-N(6))-dimethyltransferase RsmA [Mycoplasma sp.]
MLTLNDIKDLQKKYEIKTKKRFGQNFLIDSNVLNNIIEISNIKNKKVVEIGPGLGSLTRMLLKDTEELTAFEIDDDMIRVLEGEINNDKFKLIKGDFLKQTLDWKGKRTLIANLPYYITSDILFKLFENTNKFDKAIIMIQDEVADRLIAPVGSKQYGKLTISTNHFALIKKNFVVKPNSFFPVPKVNSAVISLEFKEPSNINDKEFLEFVKLSFKQRRKTLFNNWKDIMGSNNAKELIESLGLDLSIRPQNLTLENYKNAFIKRR